MSGPKNKTKEGGTQVNFRKNNSRVVEFNYNMNNDFDTSKTEHKSCYTLNQVVSEKSTQTEMTQRKTFKEYKYTLCYQMTDKNKGDLKVKGMTRQLAVDDNYDRMWYKNEVWVVNNNMTYHDAMTHLLKHNGVWYVLKEKYNKPVSPRRLNLRNVNKFEEMVSNGKGKCTVRKCVKNLCNLM